MKIGMLSACYKPVINGVTRMISLYKAELEALEHEVTIFTLGDPDPAGEEAGVIRSPAISLGDSGYYFTTRYRREAQRQLAEMEIIHCHHLFMSMEMAHRYGRCPVVYTNHTRYDLYTGSYIPLPQPAADALMRQVWPDFTDLADVVVTPSQSVRQIMLDFGVRRPIEVIENGVDLRPFRCPAQPRSKADLGLPDDAILLMYVGRLAVVKNLEILLRQFAIAQDIAPQLHLMLVGQGKLEAALQQQARLLGVAEQVHFTGAVSYEAVSDFLAAADMFVTASTSEVHPLTIIEAMAAGLPVAAPAAPGIVDTVQHGRSGFLTNHPTDGLAAAILGVALDPARRREMGAAAQRDSQRFDIRNTVAKTVALYERLRRERPDLRRQKQHGRWTRNRERLQPLLDQLTNLLSPPEGLDTGPLRLRNWIKSTPDETDSNYGEW